MKSKLFVSFLLSVISLSALATQVESMTVSDMEELIAQKYNIEVIRSYNGVSGVNAVDYKRFLTEFVPEAEVRVLQSRAKTPLQIVVQTENWNLGIIIPANWGANIEESDTNEIEVGHKSAAAVIDHILINYDYLDSDIEILERMIRSELNINVAVGIGIARVSRANYLRFLTEFLAKGKLQNLQSAVKSPINIAVVTENINGTILFPNNWGADIDESDTNEIEVGHKSAVELIAYIMNNYSNLTSDIANMEVKVENELKIYIRLATAGLTVPSRARYLRFLTALYQLGIERNIGSLNQPVAVDLYIENWNGGDVIPFNWGSDIERTGRAFYSVGDESEAALIDAIAEEAGI